VPKGFVLVHVRIFSSVRKISSNTVFDSVNFLYHLHGPTALNKFVLSEPIFKSLF